VSKRKRQKAGKGKTRKKKRARARQQGIPKMLRQNPALREALNYRHPLVGCRINKDWQEHGMAIVIVARMAPTGMVFSGFLVDVLGFGLKDVMGDYGVSDNDLGEYEFLEGVHGTDLIDCDYDLASNLVYGGLIWARKWQFKPPKEHKIWMRLLEPRNLDDVKLDRFGKDGEPFIIIPGDEIDDNQDEEIDLEAFKDPLFSPEPEPTADILRRIGDIKAVLVNYMRGFEFEDDLDVEAKKRFGKMGKPKKESEWINFLDWFLLEYRLRSGEKIVDLFLERYEDDIHPDVHFLIEDWKKVFHGLFEVKARFANGYRVRNLINEVDYTVYTTNVSEPLLELQPGDFFSSRIVPACGFHVFSGILSAFPLKGDPKIKQEMYQAAARMQTKNPALALMDNPEKLEKSREAVRKAYVDFMEFFGGEEIFGTGKEIQQHYRDFLYFQIVDKQDPTSGFSKAEEYFQRTGKKYRLPKPKFPRSLLRCKDVGMLCDPEEHVTFLEDYRYFLNIFAHPDEYLGVPYAAEVVMGYIESDSISDVPFRRIAKRYPENFKKVIDYYVEQEGFNNGGIEDFIVQFKPESYDKLPSIVVVLDQKIANARLG
jgi:hypothetical protein